MARGRGGRVQLASSSSSFSTAKVEKDHTVMAWRQNMGQGHIGTAE